MTVYWSGLFTYLVLDSVVTPKLRSACWGEWVGGGAWLANFKLRPGCWVGAGAWLVGTSGSPRFSGVVLYKITLYFYDISLWEMISILQPSSMSSIYIKSSFKLVQI